MTSVAIKLVNYTDGKVYDNKVYGYDIGYELDNVVNIDIQGGELNVNQQGIKGNKVSRSKIRNVQISQTGKNINYQNIRLIDLINFVITTSYLSKEEIFKIYTELNKPLNESVFKEKR